MTAAAAKMRLDLLLVERGLVPSRERGRALILAGRVLVREQKVDKPGAPVSQDVPIRLLGEDPPYVSRGGLKLAAALEHWKISVAGRHCLDVGASTGGFTDCLLQHGAAHVTAVDTGFGQIAMKLRNDTRVRLLERTNARFLEPGSLALLAAEIIDSMKGTGFSPYVSTTNKKGALTPEETPELTLLVMDVSFISATLLLGPVFAAAPSLTEAVILVKPQFEAGKAEASRGRGVITDPAIHARVLNELKTFASQTAGLRWTGETASPLLGPAGNKEFLALIEKTS